MQEHKKPDPQATEKKAFAKCLADGLDPMKAAFTVFPTDHKYRMLSAIQWEKDEIVVNEMKSLMGVVEVEPDKRDIHIKKLNEIFDDQEIAPRDRLTASMQIAQIEGFIAEKVEKNTTINNKIMIVTNNGTDKEWSEKIRKNQENLMNGIIEVKAIEVKEDA